MHARRVIQGESTEVMNTEMSPFPPMGGRGTTVVCSRLTSPIVVRGIAPGMWGSWGTELGDPDPSLKDTTGTPPIYSLSSRAGELELDRTGKKDVWLVMFDNKKITNARSIGVINYIYLLLCHAFWLNVWALLTLTLLKTYPREGRPLSQHL